MHILLIPGVVSLADTGGPMLERRLALQPGDEFVGGLLRAGDRCFELRRGRGDIRMLTTLQRAHRERARGQRAERARLTAQLLCAVHPQVAGVATLEILSGLNEQVGYGP